MNKLFTTLIIILVLLFAFAGLNIINSRTGSKSCVKDEDCVAFGKAGDSNAGCYNKEHTPWFRAPIFPLGLIMNGPKRKSYSCRCVEGECWVGSRVKVEPKSSEKATWECENDITFTYQGKEVTYGTVSYDGECWMDRNLGADSFAKAANDSSAYGDLFQWGRCDDGHQNRESPTYESRISTSTVRRISTPVCDANNEWDGKFIIGVGDWLEPQNDELWSTSTLTNNPCPDGWRVPTESEWSSASDDWSDNTDAFNSPLRLPPAGYRHYSEGSLSSVGDYGLYWSSTGISTARYLSFSGDDVGIYHSHRASGLSVRCLRDLSGKNSE